MRGFSSLHVNLRYFSCDFCSNVLASTQVHSTLFLILCHFPWLRPVDLRILRPHPGHLRFWATSGTLHVRSRYFSQDQDAVRRCKDDTTWYQTLCAQMRHVCLVGGLEHESYFPYWEFHHPNWFIFFRGVAQPPTRLLLYFSSISRGSRSKSKFLGLLET